MNNVALITDDKEGKVSIRLKNDSRVETALALFMDSGFWVHRQPTVQGEKTVWIDLKI